MRDRDPIFGRFIDTGSRIHRLPVGVKMLIVILPSVVTLIVRQWWLAVAVLTASVILLVASRVPARYAFKVGWVLGLMLAAIAGYQVVFGNPELGVTLSLNLLGCLYLSRIVTMTTPAPDLMEGLVAATRPLDRLGFNSERFGLAVALMLRSVGYLLGSFADVQDAVRARGQERNLFAQVSPVVINAVGYARRTGEALHARGLGDDDDVR